MSKKEPTIVEYDDKRYRVRCFGFKKANIVFLKYTSSLAPIAKSFLDKRNEEDTEDGEEVELSFDANTIIEALKGIKPAVFGDLIDDLCTCTDIENDQKGWSAVDGDELDYDIFALLLIEVCKLNYSGFLKIGNGFKASSLSKILSPNE